MAHPLPLSAFGDEAGSSAHEQVSALVAAGIKGLDVRNVDGVNVLDLSPAILENTREACESKGCHIQAVGSPINKVKLSHDTLEVECEKLSRAIKAAKTLGTRRIRLFTPEVPQGQDDAAWPDVRQVVHHMVQMATDADVVLLHENDARYYGAYPENARRMFEELGGPHFRAAFDFANTVLIGYRPLRDWFPWILPHVDTLHIKDAVEADHKVVPAGDGEGEIVATLHLMLGQGWSGPLTLEPHLQIAGPFSGYTGLELFVHAADKMRAAARAAGAETESF